MPPARADMDLQDNSESLDLSTTTEEILLAASNHDTTTLRGLLRTASANVRDEDTGTTPLHAALAACENDEDAERERTRLNGDAAQTIHGDALHEDGAVGTVKLLFENGAIWNDLNCNNETPGCVALRLGLKEAYSVIVDAGVRAELLLNRLDEFQVLGEDDEVEENEELNIGAADTPKEQEDGSHTASDKINGHREDRSELEEASEFDTEPVEAAISSARYLASELTFGGDRLLDADDNGVMMAWETDLMRRSADALVPGPGKRILNIGHGMGIIDGLLQERNPTEHHIIEAHPAVLDRLRRKGWHEKDGVVIHEGRWQDKVGSLVAEGKMFDAIYFDTFAEDYKDLKEFFSEHVISLLDQDGRFGFFNGLGADRQVCYDVYTKLVEMDLFEAGLDTEWTEVSIADLDQAGEWDGVQRKYWTLRTYRMPTCTFVG